MQFLPTYRNCGTLNSAIKKFFAPINQFLRSGKTIPDFIPVVSIRNVLDTPRLPWKIEEIVQGLDDGKFTYEDLLFECCLVKPEEIEDRIPSEWNNSSITKRVRPNFCTIRW